jgi:hypothetical protein
VDRLGESERCTYSPNGEDMREKVLLGMGLDWDRLGYGFLLPTLLCLNLMSILDVSGSFSSLG